MTSDISTARGLLVGAVFFGGIGLLLPITTYLYGFHGRLRALQMRISVVCGAVGGAFLVAAGVARLLA